MPARAKDVHTHIKCIRIHSQRGVIREFSAIARRRHEIMLELEERPDGGCGDDRPITDPEHNAVGQSSGGPGHVDDGHEPTAGEPIIANSWVTREIAADRRRHHGLEENVHVGVYRTVGGAGLFVEAANAAVHRKNELRRAGGAHAVRRKGPRIGERGCGEADAGRETRIRDGLQS